MSCPDPSLTKQSNALPCRLLGQEFINDRELIMGRQGPRETQKLSNTAPDLGNQTRAFRSPQRGHTLTPQSLSLTSGYGDCVRTGRRHLDGKRPGPKVPCARRPKTSRYSRKSPASYLHTSGAATSSQDDTFKLRLPIRRSQSKVTLAVAHRSSGNAKDSRTGQGRS